MRLAPGSGLHPAGFRAALLVALLVLPFGQAGRAQGRMEIVDLDEAPGVETRGAIPCSEINNRAMEATLVIRQHASALSVGFEQDARPQAQVLLAWLDQWTGRLRGFVELGEFSQCLDEGDAETYRRALVSATMVANQAREDLLRPVRPPRQRARR